MKQPLSLLTAVLAALALAAAPARAGSRPQGALDECYGKTRAVHVTGWTYDPDVSSQSTAVQVYLYADSGCTRQCGGVRVLTANVPRSDVNRVKGVEGDHGFNADIPVPAGTYWVKVFAVDATDDGNLQVGTTRSVVVAERGGVQLWENGPYWAETNVGADEPWDYGCYFWWGDTVGCRRENDAWVASDGSSSDFSFDAGNAQTSDKDTATLQSEGWITADGVLAPAHDAARAHFGAPWRMPTYQELCDLCYTYCDWTWTTTNGVMGYVVRGRGDFANASIFLPAAGFGDRNHLYSVNSVVALGHYWSSVPVPSSSAAKYLYFLSSNRYSSNSRRCYGYSVRPVFPAPIDLLALAADYTAEDGDVLTGTTTYNVTVPGGATVTINGVSVTGGGTVNPAPAFSSGGEAVTTKFERGAGDTWAITAFAELGNDALGADVTDAQVKVYAAGTVEGLESAAPMSEGVTVTDKRSAVKVSLEVETPPGDDSRFFRVGFGE